MIVRWVVLSRVGGICEPVNCPIRAELCCGPALTSRKSWLSSEEKFWNWIWAPMIQIQNMIDYIQYIMDNMTIILNVFFMAKVISWHIFYRSESYYFTLSYIRPTAIDSHYSTLWYLFLWTYLFLVLVYCYFYIMTTCNKDRTVALLSETIPIKLPWILFCCYLSTLLSALKIKNHVL